MDSIRSSIIRPPRVREPLSLPRIVLENVIQQLRYMTNYDGWLCDLRRVNHDFNEAILHCLFFGEDPPLFHQSHYMSCSKMGCEVACRIFANYNYPYARFCLQAKIFRRSEADLKILRGYEVLAETLALLQQALSSSDRLYTIARSRLNDHAFLPCASMSSVFTDRLSTLLCESAIRLRGLTEHYQDSHLGLTPPCHSHDAKFWLQNLACYLGDVELLDLYPPLMPISSHSWDMHVSTAQFEELIGTIALCGHTTMFKRVISHSSVKHPVDWTMALRGALCSGTTEIVTTILAHKSTSWSDMQQACLQAFRINRCLSPSRSNYEHIAKMLIKSSEDREKVDDKLMYALLFQIVIGNMKLVRLLLPRFLDQGFDGLSPLMEYDHNLLRSAFGSKNPQCVRLILEAKSHPKVLDRRFPDIIAQRNLHIAVDTNSLAICQELFTWAGQEMHTMPFVHVAAIDGTIPFMTKCLELKPDLLKSFDFDPPWYPSHRFHMPKSMGGTRFYIGEHALSNAARRLRVNNVKFLLERGARVSDALVEEFTVEWRYKKAHEEKFDAVQKLLHDHDHRPLLVEV